MSEQWHYSSQGKQFGPVSTTDLKHLIDSHRLLPNDMLWKEGMVNWVPAHTLSDLFVASTTNSPPPLPVAPNTDPLAFLHAPVIAGLHRQRFAIAVLAGLGMLATFLPWVSVPIVGSIAGTSGDGWITFVLFIPAMVLALRGNKLEPLLGNHRLGAVIPAGIACLIGVIKFFNFNSRSGKAIHDDRLTDAMAASVHIGFGIYLLILAGAALVVAAWILAKPPQNKIA